MEKRFIAISAAMAGAAMIMAGCLTTETKGKTPPKEPTLTTKTPEKKELSYKDIQLIEEKDVTGTVSAAREAANKLLADAKGIYTLKEKEANANAAKIIAKAKMEAAKTAAEEAKQEKKKVRKAVLAKANKKADAIIAKAKKEADLIRSKTIESARRAAADITGKAGKEATDIVAKAAKLRNAAQKKADEYLKLKMAEADKQLAKAVKESAKAGGAAHDGKEKGYVATAIVANKILDGILKGIKDKNYETYTKDFTKEHKTNISKKAFDQQVAALNEKVGDCDKRTYLGRLMKGPVTVYIWKGHFSKAKNNELIVEVALMELDGKIQVFAFNVAPL